MIADNLREWECEAWERFEGFGGIPPPLRSLQISPSTNDENSLPVDCLAKPNVIGCVRFWIPFPALLWVRSTILRVCACTCTVRGQWPLLFWRFLKTWGLVTKGSAPPLWPSTHLVPCRS